MREDTSERPPPTREDGPTRWSLFPSDAGDAPASRSSAFDGLTESAESMRGVDREMGSSVRRPGKETPVQSAADATEPSGGRVSLVGAGPGDPDLLTRRAWNRLQSADVVLHDSLTGDAIIDDLPPGVEIVDVGKRPPNRTSQDEINDLLVDRAAGGDHVVRLKGGDPNVFGRGGEEAEHLAAEGMPFEIVPGVSSVIAAPSVSGIPLTHRDRSSSLTVITGHQTPDKDESAIDWSAIADTVTVGGTLVILMGVSKLSENVRNLRERGVDPRTPVAMVEKVTWEDERTITGTLEDIVERSRDADVEPPAVTIVGEVVEVRDAVSDYLETTPDR